MKNNEKINSYKEYLKKVKEYETYIKLISDPANRASNSLLVSGDPGIGKTYRARKILEEHSKCPFLVVNGRISAVKLYQTMWENNDAVIVLDDVNSIIQDKKDGASLLKAATDSERTREISWNARNHDCIPVKKYNCKNNLKIAERMDWLVQTSNNKRLERSHEAKNTFPDMFYFTGALIILTNKSLHTVDKASEGAVSNRGNHMEIMFTTEGAIDFIKTFGPTMTEYNGVKMKAKTISETIKFLTSEKALQYYARTRKRPTLRNLGKIEGLYQAGMKLDLDILENNTEYAFEDNI